MQLTINDDDIKRLKDNMQEEGYTMFSNPFPGADTFALEYTDILMVIDKWAQELKEKEEEDRLKNEKLINACLRVRPED